MGKILQGNLIN